MFNTSLGSDAALQEMEDQVRQNMEGTYTYVLEKQVLPFQKSMALDLIQRIGLHLSDLLTQVGIIFVETILKLEEQCSVTATEKFQENLLMSDLKDKLPDVSKEVDLRLLEAIEAWVEHELYAVARGYVEFPPEWLGNWCEEELRLAEVYSSELDFSDSGNICGVIVVYELGSVLGNITPDLAISLENLSVSNLWTVGSSKLGLPSLTK